jgi:hypothetical protein
VTASRLADGGICTVVELAKADHHEQPDSSVPGSGPNSGAFGLGW